MSTNLPWHEVAAQLYLQDILSRDNVKFDGCFRYVNDYDGFLQVKLDHNRSQIGFVSMINVEFATAKIINHPPLTLADPNLPTKLRTIVKEYADRRGWPLEISD